MGFPRLAHETMSAAIQFVNTDKGGCSKWGCSTCGGSYHFRQRISAILPSQSDVMHFLCGLGGEYIPEPKTDSNVMSQIFGMLSRIETFTVLRDWETRGAEDPELAVFALKACSRSYMESMSSWGLRHHIEFSEKAFRRLLASAAPLILADAGLASDVLFGVPSELRSSIRLE